MAPILNRGEAAVIKKSARTDGRNIIIKIYKDSSVGRCFPRPPRKGQGRRRNEARACSALTVNLLPSGGCDLHKAPPSLRKKRGPSTRPCCPSVPLPLRLHACLPPRVTRVRSGAPAPTTTEREHHILCVCVRVLPQDERGRESGRGQKRRREIRGQRDKSEGT